MKKRHCTDAPRDRVAPSANERMQLLRSHSRHFFELPLRVRGAPLPRRNQEPREAPRVLRLSLGRSSPTRALSTPLCVQPAARLYSCPFFQPLLGLVHRSPHLLAPNRNQKNTTHTRPRSRTAGRALVGAVVDHLGPGLSGVQHGTMTVRRTTAATQKTRTGSHLTPLFPVLPSSHRSSATSCCSP